MLNLFRAFFVESRRLLALLLIPWVGVLTVCLLATWYSLFVIGFDALLAPVLKLWLVLKPLLFKSLPALFLWLWLQTGAKLVAWLGELFIVIGTLLGGWKAWSAKKFMRQVARFILSLSARFVVVSVVLNLLFGHERRGVKLLPRFTLIKLRASPIGGVIRWWSASTDRRKRLILGLLLCAVLVLLGQAMLGLSVLLFDVVWELLLILWLWLTRLWRWVGPFLIRLVPNFIGNFVTQKILPTLVDLVPVIKDDIRVNYLRYNVRRYIRRAKAWLYLKSRARRLSVRSRIQPWLGQGIRKKKEELLHRATRIDSDKIGGD